jgi:hypothetical protein
MNSDTVRTYGPYAVILAVLVMISPFVVPLLLSMIWGWIEIGVGVAAIIMFVMFVPDLALLLRNLVWAARKEVIQTMPIETLETGLQQVWNGITQLEQRIAQAETELKGLEHLPEADRALLDDEDMKVWDEQLDELRAMDKDLVAERNNQLATYNTLKRNVAKAKLMQRMGQGYQAVMRTLTAGTEGQGASDMNVAFDHIQRQMNEAQAHIQLILSRPKGAVRKPATVTEISPAALPPAEEQPTIPRQAARVMVSRPTIEKK